LVEHTTENRSVGSSILPLATTHVVRFAEVLSNSVQLVNDSVSAFHRELPVGGSSGVQIVTDYSTAYPSTSALSRTRASRVTIVTSGGGSPSNSAVARCTASSVRMGSTGNGRRTRSSTESVTATMKERRSNRRSARTASRSSSAVSRAPMRARRIARAASAIVNAEVTWRPRVRTDFSAAASRSSSAATNALDSMYRIPLPSAAGAGASTGRAGREGPLVLRFATIGVNQFDGGSSRQPNIWPAFCRVTGLKRRANHSGGDKLVKAAWPAPRL
jgi:hypothetical protein